MAAPSARHTRARSWRYRNISRNSRAADAVSNANRLPPLTLPLRGSLPLPARRERAGVRGLFDRPEPAQAIAVPQQPVEGDQGAAALDGTGIDQRLDFGQRLDDDADVLLFFQEAVHPAGRGRIDAAAKQHHAFVLIA